MLTGYMDVNFNKYSNVSFLAVVCTVFVSSQSHIQVLKRSSKAGAALVKTIASFRVSGVRCTLSNVTFMTGDVLNTPRQRLR